MPLKIGPQNVFACLTLSVSWSTSALRRGSGSGFSRETTFSPGGVDGGANIAASGSSPAPGPGTGSRRPGPGGNAMGTASGDVDHQGRVISLADQLTRRRDGAVHHELVFRPGRGVFVHPLVFHAHQVDQL